MVHVGHDGYVNKSLIAAVSNLHSQVGTNTSAFLRRLINDAEDTKRLIDYTFGHKTKSIIILTSGQVVLSSLSSSTITSRMKYSDTSPK